MRKFVAVLMMLGVATVAHAVVIGDFEGTSMDGWSGNESPTPVLVNSTTAGTVTLGTQSLSVTTNGGYWKLRWDAPVVPTELGLLTFDVSMIQSEWPNAQWTRVGDKIAIGGDDAASGGWLEYVPTAANWTWRADGSPAPAERHRPGVRSRQLPGPVRRPRDDRRRQPRAAVAGTSDRPASQEGGRPRLPPA